MGGGEWCTATGFTIVCEAADALLVLLAVSELCMCVCVCVCVCVCMSASV